MLERVALRIGLHQHTHAYLMLLRVGFSVPMTSLPLRWALTPPFHPYRLLRTGGLLSVPLSVAGRSRRLRLAVSQHPTLRSPDLPPAGQARPATVWFASTLSLADWLLNHQAGSKQVLFSRLNDRSSELVCGQLN